MITMAAISDALETILFNLVFRATPWTVPTSWFLALHTADPGETGANELAVANGYARQALVMGAPGAGTGAGVNTNEPAFTASGASWGLVTHFSIWDSSAAGVMLYHSALTNSRTITDGATSTFAAGIIAAGIGGALSNYLKDALYNAIFRGITYTAPASVHLALHTASPGGTGANELAVANGYAREALTVDAPTDGVGSNTGAIAFTAAGGSWGTITHFSVKDAAAAGNSLVESDLDVSQLVEDTTTLNWAAGALDLSFA